MNSAASISPFGKSSYWLTASRPSVSTPDSVMAVTTIPASSRRPLISESLAYISTSREETRPQQKANHINSSLLLS